MSHAMAIKAELQQEYCVFVHLGRVVITHSLSQPALASVPQKRSGRRTNVTGRPHSRDAASLASLRATRTSINSQLEGGLAMDIRLKRWSASIAVGVMLSAHPGIPLSATAAPTTDAAESPAPKSPIKHVIVLIGENRSFDHTYAPTSRSTGRPWRISSPR